MDRIKVRIEPQKNIEAERWDNVRKKVVESLHNAFMINMDVEIIPPGTLPVYKMKAKRFRDLRS